jgi:geranylgeranyl pyrophosphate synthase
MSSRPLEPSLSGEPFAHWTARRCEQVERALEACLPGPATRPERLHEAMRYAVLGGGKRVRPLLVLRGRRTRAARRRRYSTPRPARSS